MESPTTIWFDHPTDPEGTARHWLEVSAHLIAYYADRDPEKWGAWEGTYRVEQKKLLQLTGKLYEMQADGLVPDEVVAAWEEEFKARMQAEHAASVAKHAQRLQTQWERNPEPPHWVDPWVAPREQDVNQARRYSCEARQRAAHAQQRANSLRSQALSVPSIPLRSRQLEHHRTPATRSRTTHRKGSGDADSDPDGGDDADGDDAEPTRGPGARCLWHECSNRIPAGARPHAEFCGISPRTGKTGSANCRVKYKNWRDRQEDQQPTRVDPESLPAEADFDHFADLDSLIREPAGPVKKKADPGVFKLRTHRLEPAESPKAVRTCLDCGAHLRTANTEQICDPCLHKARMAPQRVAA